MDFRFNQDLAHGYSSKSQIVRILTESWAINNVYCPHCGNSHIEHFPNNRAVADFYCPVCQSEYELKSKSGAIGHKIPDGAYHTFIQRISSNNNPDFFILSYNPVELCVENLWIVPKHFLFHLLLNGENLCLQMLDEPDGLGVIYFLIRYQNKVKFV